MFDIKSYICNPFEEKKDMRVKFLAVGICILLLNACSTPKNISYFQDANDLTKEQLAQMQQDYVPKIMNGDVLTITVSSIDPVAVAPFNLPIVSFPKREEGNTIPGGQNVGSSQIMQTYTVDSEGCINYPVIGKIKVAGLTKQEVITLLEKKISTYVKDPIVNVQIINFKVTVLGEVLKPGTYNVNTERVTILDALGLASDLTIYGDRKNVMVVRDNNGKMEIAHFDLTKSDMFTSPYFYLQQNDIVYVDPNSKRKQAAKYSQSEQFNLSVITAVISSLSVIASVITTFIAIKNR